MSIYSRRKIQFVIDDKVCKFADGKRHGHEEWSHTCATYLIQGDSTLFISAIRMPLFAYRKCDIDM